MQVKMEASWKEVLADEFKKPYFKGIVEHLKTEKEQGKTIYPAGPQIFHAFDATPFDKVSVVVLGQDPYHGPRQAHGLSFSVQKGVHPPPSLVNIFKELHEDTGMAIPSHGNLEHWAEQGVLLLNASLTVRAGEPMSHAKIGWHQLTDTAISKVSAEREHVVFMLWGRFAQEKMPLIDGKRHLVLKSAHPSPLSAHNGFFGSRPFSKANAYLASHGRPPIDWSLT
jgi:uracil-DNA glycosylase